MGILSGKTILVTGGSRGIGEAIALEAAREGADVIITYREQAKQAENVANRIRALGQNATVIQMDLADEASIERAVARTYASTKQVDCLINNAAILERADFANTSSLQLTRVLKTNLVGTHTLTRLIAKHMKAQGIRGSITNITSDRDTTVTNDLYAYQLAKAGLLMMSRICARELAPHRIRVNCVAPGATVTDMQNAYRQKSPALFQQRMAKIPLGRAAQPDEIAKTVVFVASDSASYMTGSRLLVDGGRTAGLALPSSQSTAQSTTPSLPRAKL